MCWVSDSGEIPLPNLSFPSSDQSYRRQSRKHLLKKKKKWCRLRSVGPQCYSKSFYPSILIKYQNSEKFIRAVTKVKRSVRASSWSRGMYEGRFCSRLVWDRSDRQVPRESRVRGEPRTSRSAGVGLLFAHARMSVPRADKDKFHCGWTNRLSSSSANKYPIFWIGSQLTSWYNLSWWSAQLCRNEGLGYITDNLSDYNCPITEVINRDAIAKSPSLWTPRDRIQTVFDGRPIA